MQPYRIVQVDATGHDDEGNDVNMHAHESKVREGMMTNETILAQYPNGDIRWGNIVRITNKGLTELAKEFSAGSA